MTEEKRVAFIMSQITCAQIAMAGMIAENQQREHLGLVMAYVEFDFAKLVIEYGIGYNDVLGYLQG